MNQFAQIESRIKELFEKSSDRLPWTDSRASLVRQLSSSLQDYLLEEPDCLKRDVSKIRIFLSAQDYGRWQQEPARQTLLSEAVSETLVEFNCKPVIMPDLEMVARNSLQNGEVVFTIEEKFSELEQTGVVNYKPIGLRRDFDRAKSNSVFLTLDDETLVPIHKNVLNVGRHSDNDIVVLDSRVSRRHAQIRKTRAGYMVFDVGSTGGTYVNSERVTSHLLRSGDVVSLAGYHLLFTEETDQDVVPQRGKTAEIIVQNDRLG